MLRGRDPRERSPPRELFPSNGSYRDRAPSTARPTREAPSVESVNDRLAKILAQRKAESGPPSAPKTQPPTPPTPAQDAQGQVQPDLERRVQELEQRHQADMTTVQQQATAIATLQQQHAELRHDHNMLVAELKKVLGGKPNMATETVPETAIKPMADQTMTDSELFLADQRARYPNLFMSQYAPAVQQTLPLHQAQQPLPEQQTTANVESQMPPPQFQPAQQPLTQAHIEEAAEVPLPQESSQPAPSPALPGFSGGFEGMFDSTGVNVFTYKPPDGDSRPNNGYIPPPPRND
ncbi:hypothetical protein J4E89_009397 [Alternaria sp. Ai002NY15]|nr:hypothetical protein J4E89_009397 [Alternaria sp. Ai002NY15]